VVASFYPLVRAERVGGGGVFVRNLTPPGVEPHDLELTPDDLEAIAEADVVVYLGGGFQSVVEDAVEAEATGITVDALEGIDPLPAPSGDEDDDGSGDPHVWLDPVLYSGIASRVATAIGEAEARTPLVSPRTPAISTSSVTLDAEFRLRLADATHGDGSRTTRRSAPRRRVRPRAARDLGICRSPNPTPAIAEPRPRRERRASRRVLPKRSARGPH
jgi:zinc transport system substrate-binding protein